MKKFYFLLMGIVSFIGINTVSADTYVADKFYDSFDNHIEKYVANKENINTLIEYWENNHSDEYPYYFIIGRIGTNTSGIEVVSYSLYSSKSTDIVLQSDQIKIIDTTFDVVEGLFLYSYQYTSNNGFDYDGFNSSPVSTIGSSYIIDSNFMPTFKYSVYSYTQSGAGTITEDYDTIKIPTFISDTNSLIISEIEIKDGDRFPTLVSLYDGSYVPNLNNNYTEIDLNKYSYVVLTLKDYTERDTFTSTMFVKGQLCATTLYNYGLEEKKDYISGYQTPPCSYYYNDFTPFTSYIKSEDIENHAIYYLTTYDTSKPNFVKIDNSVYDITYITSDTENEPYVSINGKNYPVLPYSSLSDSATLTEKNGVSNTWECAKYDTNCIVNSSGISMDDLFSKPLEMLKSVWSAILTIFSLITEFIVLLPSTMQGFLYIAFGISIVLGIIKIIL